MGTFQNIQRENEHHSQTLIQPSLEIGKDDDEHEKEANHVADKVMKMSASDDEKKKMKESSSKVQMMPDSKTGTMQESPVKIQMFTDSSTGGMMASKNVEQGINNSKGGGQSLSPDLQNELGSKMDADFSDVKVHTDENAVQMNKEVGAKAFTHGNDVYFNKGEYNPTSGEGKHLLAHELTHTVQQSGKISKKIQRQNIPGTAFGSINPLKLVFVQIVPYTPPEPGGWRAVSVIVSFLYESLGGIFTGSFFRRQEINMEIGVPIKTRLGDVSVSSAQIYSVAAMDAAAQIVSESGELGTPAAVYTMRSCTQAALQAFIPGARVSAPINNLTPIRL